MTMHRTPRLACREWRIAAAGFVAVGLAAMAVTVGCGESSAKLPAANVRGSDEAAAEGASAGRTAGGKADAAGLLAEMTKTYAQAKSYEDAGELRISVETENGDKQSAPAIPFSVAFERPNKIRIHSLEASIVADGQELRASADSLEKQVLVQPCPAVLNVKNVEADPLLAHAMQGQIDAAMPQLELLLDSDAIKQIAPDGSPTLLGDEQFDGQVCHRVAIKGKGGTSVFWIATDSHLLAKYEFPSDSFKQKFSLKNASISAEFKGARIDEPIAADAFKFEVPQDAKLVKRFLPPPPEPPSPLLGQQPAEFTFVDYRGGTIGSEGLAGKVVVLDMWATWCGWCFEGFPNLQKVYDQFKDNDKVVILAVNTDELTVSDDKVRQSFEKARLTIPIARDGRRAADEVFKVQGLPTMVVLGANGAIEDYHIGFDAKLAETLPAKINRLLAGESLAQEELDRYQKELKEYEEKEADALVANVGGKPE